MSVMLTVVETRSWYMSVCYFLVFCMFENFQNKKLKHRNRSIKTEKE